MAPLRSPAALVGIDVSGRSAVDAGVRFLRALLPELRAQWGLSYASAGWIEGAFQAGYLITVPMLVTLTDRVDARRIFAVGAAIGGLAALGLRPSRRGCWSACLFRALAGVGLAGTFMPGLRLLSDRIEGTANRARVRVLHRQLQRGGQSLVLVAGMIAERYVGGRPSASRPSAA